jgi:putative tryptophan/tyrosine transport system substrate-binding protein
MRRREFIAGVGSAAAWLSTVGTQATTRPPLVVFIWLYSENLEGPRSLFRELLKGLEELGDIEGRDFKILHRGAGGNPNTLPKVASDVVQLNPDLIVASSTITAVPVKNATSTIPIVVPALADPIALGLVESEARPGGNLTGIAPYVKGLPAKQLELAREIVPGATRIGLLDDVPDPKGHLQRPEIEAAAQTLNVRIVPAEVRNKDDIAAAYQALETERVEVVIVEQSSMLFDAAKELAQAAAATRLPSVYGYREHVAAGGLISYGIDLKAAFRRAAYFVDKILKGAKPSDLPVEFPTKLEMVINLKTAKALGLNIPPSLLARADEVIE